MNSNYIKKRNFIEVEEEKSLNILSSLFSIRKNKFQDEKKSIYSKHDIKSIETNNCYNYNYFDHYNQLDENSIISHSHSIDITTEEIEQNEDSSSENSTDIGYNYYNDFDYEAYSQCSSDDDYYENNNNDEINDSTLKDNYTILLPFAKFSGFCITEMLDSINSLKELNLTAANINNDNPLYLHDSCAMTRAQFWEDFNRLKLKFKLRNECCEDFISFIKKAFPCADLSNIIHLNYSSYESKKYFLQKYFTKVTIDVCINGCMVFTGDYQFNELCLSCSEPRYSDTCKPCFNHNTVGRCTHANRRNKKTVEYRSIISLLKDLISSHPSFLDLINYYDYGIKTDPNSFYVKDVKDGKSYKRNMNEMKYNFQKYKEQRKDKTREIIEVSLCLSWFYDGAQLYHHLIYSYLPLVFTISNLPPNLRNKLGIGTFLLTINTLPPGSYVEFFLIFDCFMQELLTLFDGISFISKDKEYYIQCRLICSILDLPALCKVFSFSSMFNSIDGCVLCNWGGGTYNKYIKKVKYTNSRLHLPFRHYLRSIGFHICSCPPTEDESGNLINDCNDKQLCKLWDARVKKWISLFDENNSNDVSAYIWYNQDIADVDEIGLNIKNEAVFETQEYEMSLPFKRHENEYYDHKATLAIEMKAKVVSKKQLRKISVNGIKGFSPLRSLPYINYKTDICQDPAHVLFVLALMILNVWTCDKNYRMFKTGVQEYYKSLAFQNIFDCLYDEKIEIPWNFGKNEQMRVEAYFKCLLIPQGSKSKFNIVKGNIFKQKGIIKGSGKITLISVYMNLILFGNLHMSIGYRALFRIFSNVFSRIRSKKIFKKDVIPLFRRCNELRSLWEGYIPMTEMIQMLHALEDISMHVLNQGPIAGFNAMHGEQAIGFVKNLSHTKGSSRPELKAFNEVAAIEFDVAKTFYSKLDADRTLTDYTSLYWNTTCQTYVYNNERNLFDGFSENVTLNFTEFGHLLETFHRIILSHYCYDMIMAITNSSLFRILNLFKNKKHRMKNKEIIDYFRLLINAYDNIIDISCNRNDRKMYKNQQLKLLKIFDSLPTNGNNIGILESDINTIKQILKYYEKKPVFTIYKRVLLPFSIILRGRGFQYSESNKTNSETKNHLNNLEDHFYEKNQYSSWCKIRQQETIEVDKRVIKEYYGQANYFFQLPTMVNETEFPDYFILKNIKFASVTSYTFDFHKIIDIELILKNLNQNDILSHSHLNTINIRNNECNNMEDSNPYFITLEELLPTEVLTFGFIHRGFFSYKAIYPYADYKSPALEEYFDHKENFIIGLNDETWLWKNDWYLAFIDGSPENLINKETSTVLEDIEYEDSFWKHISDNKYEYW